MTDMKNTKKSAFLNTDNNTVRTPTFVVVVGSSVATAVSSNFVYNNIIQSGVNILAKVSNFFPFLFLVSFSFFF